MTQQYNGRPGEAEQAPPERKPYEQENLAHTPGMFTDGTPGTDAGAAATRTATDAAGQPLESGTMPPAAIKTPAGEARHADLPDAGQADTGPAATWQPGPDQPSWDQPGSAQPSTGQQAKDVAKTATEQAKHVAQETGSQLRSLADTATQELRGQAGTQQERVASGLHTLADDLASMRTGEGSDRLAGELMQEVSSRAHRAADWLEHREPGRLLDEVRDYARRHPGTFLLGALAAGLVVGRLTRGMVAAGKDDAGGARLPAPAAPVADTRAGRAPVTASPATGHVTPDDLAYSGGGGRYERESEVSP
ncbi:hypothetical protein [Catellatospora sp. NPDC049609]|uniref:hypothetical protein n=1 Tax=Catellatospora sp. NPDC049609 TaxID=3155505 RepID=UPI0034464854